MIEYTPEEQQQLFQDASDIRTRLFVWARQRSGGNPEVYQTLCDLGSLYTNLITLEVQDGRVNAAQLLHDFTDFVGARGRLGAPRDYELDDRLRAIDGLPRGQKQPALRELARELNVAFATLDRRLKMLRADARKAAVPEEQRRSWVEAVRQRLGSKS